MRRDPDPLRGTGRTQRMLEAVIADLRRGARSVLVFGATCTQAEELMRRFADLIDPFGVTLEHGRRVRELRVGRAVVRFESINNEERAVCGLDPRCFYDHYALERGQRR